MALPELSLKFLEEILQDIVNFIRIVAPELTDWNVGSRVRTISESVAIEIDEQYHQIAELLGLWNLRNLRGTQLDERLAEWNVERRGPLQAAGGIVVSNSQLITTFLAAPASVGDTSVLGLSTAGLPAGAFTIRIGEGLATVEDVAVITNTVSSGTLALAAPLVNDHSANERVSLVSGSPLTIAQGTRVRVPATDVSPERTASVLQTKQIAPGNLDSPDIPCLMDSPGLAGNVAANEIREFVGTAPFDGAQVRNDAPFSGGRDAESDEQFLSRGLNKLASLARATPLSLEQLIVGLEFTDTSDRTWRIISAKKEERTVPGSLEDFVYLYIWPGALDFITSNQVTVAEVLTAAADDGQKFFRLANTAIVPGSLILERQEVGTTVWVPLVKGQDYFLNEGTGWIEIANPGLAENDQLRAARYEYYTELINYVQGVVNGLETDPVTFPGIIAAGVKCLVTFPRPVQLDPVRVAIQVQPGFTEAEVAVPVADAITQYLTGLAIGDDVIVAEIIERAMSVRGMYNIQVQSPKGDVSLLEDQVLDLEDLDVIVS